MDQVRDKPFIVGIMLCGRQTAAWNESCLIQHHSRMRKNFCAHINLQESQWIGASELHQFVYMSRIHSESLASEIQECSVTRILNFYMRNNNFHLSKMLMLPCRGWGPKSRGGGRESSNWGEDSLAASPPNSPNLGDHRDWDKAVGSYIDPVL